MPRPVRIVSEFCGTADEPYQSNYKIIWVAMLNGDNLVRQKAYGIAHDDDARYPFELTPPINNRPGQFFFGKGDDFDSREKTNVFERSIQVGSVFTRWIQGDNNQEIEQPYKIVQLMELA